MIDSDVTKTADKEVPGPCPLTNTHGNTIQWSVVRTIETN